MKTFLDPKIAEFIYTGLIAGFGGFSNYLYKYSKDGKDFKAVSFFINISLAFFIGNVVGSFLPETFQYRDGMLLISGFVCYPLLDTIEKKAPSIITNAISKKSR